MSQAQEIRHEADAIERNRAKAPTTAKLAALIFDARNPRFPAECKRLEELAITVDGWAQAGHEVGGVEAAAIFSGFLAIVGRAK